MKSIKIKDLLEQYGNREVDVDKFKSVLLPEKPKTVWDLKDGDEYWLFRKVGLSE